MVLTSFVTAFSCSSVPVTTCWSLPSDTIGADSAYLVRHDIEIENLTGPTPEELYKKFGPSGFPTTMILDPKGDIVFWGSVAKIDRTLNYDSYSKGR